MSRGRSNAKPVVVEAPVASTPAGLPLAPVASPVVAAPALATAEGVTLVHASELVQ